jgi:cysteine synthase
MLRQMEGDIDAVVVGVGSGGMLTGIGRCMRNASPKTAMVLADPQGSILAPYVETGNMPQVGSWAVEGIGEDFIPPNCDLSLVNKAYRFGPGKPQPRAICSAPRHSGGLIIRHAAGGGARLSRQSEPNAW